MLRAEEIKNFIYTNECSLDTLVGILNILKTDEETLNIKKILKAEGIYVGICPVCGNITEKDYLSDKYICMKKCRNGRIDIDSLNYFYDKFNSIAIDENRELIN